MKLDFLVNNVQSTIFVQSTSNLDIGQVQISWESAAILDFGQSVSAFLANTLQSTIFVQSTSNLDMVYMTIKTQLSSNFVKIEPKTVDWRPFWTLTGSPPSGHRSLASCYDQKSINNPYVLTKTMIYRSIITKNIMFFKKMLIIAHFRSHFVFVSTK